jgi:hypothetical protein
VGYAGKHVVPFIARHPFQKDKRQEGGSGECNSWGWKVLYWQGDNGDASISALPMMHRLVAWSKCFFVAH